MKNYRLGVILFVCVSMIGTAFLIRQSLERKSNVGPTAKSIQKVGTNGDERQSSDYHDSANNGCKDCGKKGKYTPIPGVSDESNEKVRVLYEDIWPMPSLSDEQVEKVVLMYAQDEDDVYVRRWAGAIMSDRYVNAKMSDDAILMIRGAFESGLYDLNWRMRVNAIATSEETLLVNEDSIRSRIIQMMDDEHPRVAARARGSVEAHHLLQPDDG